MKALVAAPLSLLACASAIAGDQWQHAAICADVVKAGTPSNVQDRRDGERTIEWLGRHGWELAAIEKDHCVDRGRSSAQRVVYQDVFWFKRRADPNGPQTVFPSASDVHR